MVKLALITGITGQDGSYLAEFLLDKEYHVYGILRRSSSFNTKRIDHIFGHERLHLVYGDMIDESSLVGVVGRMMRDHKVDPNDPGDIVFEVYNLAAQSHVAVSFEVPLYTGEADALGTLRLLEAIRINGLANLARFYQASTSELYGLVQEVPQSETTPFYPRSPYGVAKLYAFWITKNYREAYGMYACNGILFNHESERRGGTFVTRKITRGVAAIAGGEAEEVVLGNLDARRDWGYAPDYVRGMWMMLQQEDPEDFVLATGEMHTVREFVEAAFDQIGLTITWRGSGVREVGVDQHGDVRVRVSPKYYRPAEVEQLLGDPTKAAAKLGWRAETTFGSLVQKMMAHDLKRYVKMTAK